MKIDGSSTLAPNKYYGSWIGKFHYCLGRIITLLFLSSSTRALVAPRQCIVSQSIRTLLTTRAKTNTHRLAMSTTTTAATTPSSLRFVDIGANLLEERFTAGVYRGTFRHEPDLDLVWQRAYDVGCRRIILTAGTVEESRQAVIKAREWNVHKDNPGIRFYSTVGVHPTRCRQEFVDKAAERGTTAEALLEELCQVALDGQTDGTVVAVGELGLGTWQPRSFYLDVGMVARCLAPLFFCFSQTSWPWMDFFY